MTLETVKVIGKCNFELSTLKVWWRGVWCCWLAFGLSVPVPGNKPCPIPALLDVSPFRHSDLPAPFRVLIYVSSISGCGTFIHMVYSGVKSVYTTGLGSLV